MAEPAAPPENDSGSENCDHTDKTDNETWFGLPENTYGVVVWLCLAVRTEKKTENPWSENAILLGFHTMIFVLALIALAFQGGFTWFLWINFHLANDEFSEQEHGVCYTIGMLQLISVSYFVTFQLGQLPQSFLNILLLVDTKWYKYEGEPDVKRREIPSPSIGRRFLVFAGILVCSAEVVLVVWLTYVGIQYIFWSGFSSLLGRDYDSDTKGIDEIVMATLALQFIMEIDESVFKFMLPKAIQSRIQKVRFQNFLWCPEELDVDKIGYPRSGRADQVVSQVVRQVTVKEIVSQLHKEHWLRAQPILVFTFPLAVAIISLSAVLNTRARFKCGWLHLPIDPESENINEELNAGQDITNVILAVIGTICGLFMVVVWGLWVLKLFAQAEYRAWRAADSEILRRSYVTNANKKEYSLVSPLRAPQSAQPGQAQGSQPRVNENEGPPGSAWTDQGQGDQDATKSFGDQEPKENLTGGPQSSIASDPSQGVHELQQSETEHAQSRLQNQAAQGLRVNENRGPPVSPVHDQGQGNQDSTRSWEWPEWLQWIFQWFGLARPEQSRKEEHQASFVVPSPPERGDQEPNEYATGGPESSIETEHEQWTDQEPNENATGGPESSIETEHEQSTDQRQGAQEPADGTEKSVDKLMATWQDRDWFVDNL